MKNLFLAVFVLISSTLFASSALAAFPVVGIGQAYGTYNATQIALRFAERECRRAGSTIANWHVSDFGCGPDGICTVRVDAVCY